MITVVPTDRIYLCCGYTDMRKGIPGLSVLVQEALNHDPHAGAVFCFRGRRGHILKILSHDGSGMALFIKRLDEGFFHWPMAGDKVALSLTKADLSLLLEGIDWKRPQRVFRTRLAG